MGRTVRNGKRGPGAGGRGLGVVFAALALLAGFAPSALATTRIRGGLYSAVSPLRPNTTCVLAWPSFTAAGDRQVLAGSTTLTITAGVVDVRLEPTDTAVPVFTYELVCRNAGVIVAREFWGVETTDSVLTPAQVWRATSQVAKGDKGERGDQGEQGIQGEIGLTGATGAAGRTVLNGSGAPSGGVDGDFYLKTSTNCLYGPKDSGLWPGECVQLGSGLEGCSVAVSGTSTTIAAEECGLGLWPAVVSCVYVNGTSYLPGPALLDAGALTITSITPMSGRCKLVGSASGAGTYLVPMSGTSVTVLATTHLLNDPYLVVCYNAASPKKQYEPGGWSRNGSGDVVITSTTTMSGFCILQQ